MQRIEKFRTVEASPRVQTLYNHHQRKLEILWLHYELPKNNSVTLTNPKLLIYDLAESNNVLKTCDPRTNVCTVETKANNYY